jgi:hypothetical protein
MGIVDLFTSSGVAGITGLLGGLGQKWFDLRKVKLDYFHKIKMSELELRSLELEQSHELAVADKQVERSKVEGELKVTQKEIDAFQASYDYAKNERDWLRWIRPAITFYVLVWATILCFNIWIKNNGLDGFDEIELKALLTSTVNTVTYLLIMCVSWWFGSRGGNLGVSK